MLYWIYLVWRHRLHWVGGHSLGSVQLTSCVVLGAWNLLTTYLSWALLVFKVAWGKLNIMVAQHFHVILKNRTLFDLRAYCLSGTAVKALFLSHTGGSTSKWKLLASQMLQLYSRLSCILVTYAPLIFVGFDQMSIIRVLRTTTFNIRGQTRTRPLFVSIILLPT